MDSIRFIIITLPSGENFEILQKAIQKISETGNTYTAMSYPPHMTLRTGAVVPLDEIDGFIEEFGRVVGCWRPFPVETDGLICLETGLASGKTSCFLHYRIKENRALCDLHLRLMEYRRYVKSGKRDFYPHISLGYDDFEIEGYLKVQALMQREPDFFPENFSWLCDHVALFHKPENKWEPFHIYRGCGVRS